MSVISSEAPASLARALRVRFTSCRSAGTVFDYGREPGTRPGFWNAHLGTLKEDRSMRVMVIVKGDENSEAGVMPSEQMLKEMGAFNEELVNAGVMLSGDGLKPSSRAPASTFLAQSGW